MQSIRGAAMSVFFSAEVGLKLWAAPPLQVGSHCTIYHFSAARGPGVNLGKSPALHSNQSPFATTHSAPPAELPAGNFIPDMLYALILRRTVAVISRCSTSRPVVNRTSHLSIRCLVAAISCQSSISPQRGACS